MLADRLAAEADQIATLTPGSCEARDAATRFRARVIASIGRIPPRYQEPLMSAANSLSQRLNTCAPQPVEPEHGEGHGREKHGKKHDEDD